MDLREILLPVLQIKYNAAVEYNTNIQFPYKKKQKTKTHCYNLYSIFVNYSDTYEIQWLLFKIYEIDCNKNIYFPETKINLLLVIQKINFHYGTMLGYLENDL